MFALLKERFKTLFEDANFHFDRFPLYLFHDEVNLFYPGSTFSSKSLDSVKISLFESNFSIDKNFLDSIERPPLDHKCVSKSVFLNKFLKFFLSAPTMSHKKPKRNTLCGNRLGSSE